MYCDRALTFKCWHIDPVPAHVAMHVCARDFHMREYTTLHSKKIVSRPRNYSAYKWLIILVNVAIISFNKYEDTLKWNRETVCLPPWAENAARIRAVYWFVCTGLTMVRSPLAHIEPSLLEAAQCLKSFDKTWTKKSNILMERGREKKLSSQMS